MAVFKRCFRIRNILLLLLGGLFFSCGNEGRQLMSRFEEKTGGTEREKKVMRATLAGAWYSADPQKLRQELEGYLAEVSEASYTDVCAVIQPHAGYAYSGPTAAYGMKQVGGRDYKRVVVVGPTHRVSMPNQVSVADATHFATPLGEIPMDTEMIDRLKKYPFVRYVPMAHESENSVELQIPFLQVVLKDFELVILVVGQLDEAGARKVAKALLETMDGDTLLVISGDFTHFGPRFDYLPFREDVPARLKELDLGAFEQIRKKNLGGWFEYLDQTGATICGRCAIGVLLAMLSEEQEVHLLEYTTSGELTGDWQNSVSYISAAVTGPWKTSGEENTMSDKETPAIFTDAEKKDLLKLARGTLETYLKNRRKPSPEDLGVTVTPAMKQVMGVFVTLTKYGELRGCIGEILPRRPLVEGVAERVLSAALEDPRFPPVQAGELSDIEMEISALTPPKPVDSYEDIVIGRHGMILQKGYASAVFLPQVAPEQGWDLATTLTHLSMKAGLSPQAWKEGCQFEVFEANVFNEAMFEEP